MSRPTVSILIPVFSEVLALNETIQQLLHREDLPVPIEVVLLVHPESSERCLENIATLTQQYLNVRALVQKRIPGQGFAFREGIASSDGEYILMMNADLETNPSHVPLLIERILRGDAEMIIASRWAKGAHFDISSYGRIKALCNFIFQFFFRAVIRTEISDLTFCFKIAEAKVFKSLRWKGERHEFAMESTVVPILMGLRVKEIPTTWVARKEGVSNNPFRRNLRHLNLMLRIIFQWSCGKLKAEYQ